MDAEVVGRSPGRPRRFDPATELRLIVDSANKLLRENDYEDVSVAAILTRSGLSTRSFYRHFSSKDELLIAMFRENAEQMGAILATRVSAAASARDGLIAWVDEMLRLRFDTRTARRVAIFEAPEARRAVGYRDAQGDAVELLVAPLRGVLDTGLRDGSFPAARPERDTRSIYALVADVMWWAPATLTREQALEHVLRFMLPGLGSSLDA